ncbi:MAG: BA14K family protein [Parvibaculaceae bacterium]
MLARLFAPAAAALALIAGASSAFANSPAYCDNYARQVASERTDGGEIIGGGIGGAITGALIGGILGGGKGAGQGAAIGGGVGLFGGAAHSSSKWNAIYHAAFQDCMDAGYRQEEASYEEEIPVEGSPAWYDYCASKYRSFNPRTGRYLARSGAWVRCR